MIELRKASIEDIDKLVLLFEAYRHFYRQKAAPDQAKIFLTERLNQKDSTILIALDKNNQEAAGFTQLYPSFTSTRMKKTWILNDLFVSPEFRGKGVSKMLIEAAKAHCRSTDSFGLILETEKTNLVGNKLYPSAGFTLETSNYYYWINE